MPRQRKKLLIVDGYNVLRSGSRYQRIDDPDYTDDWFNTARDALVNDVINFAGREWRAIVVFDGGGNAFSAGEATSRPNSRAIARRRAHRVLAGGAERRQGHREARPRRA